MVSGPEVKVFSSHHYSGTIWEEKTSSQEKQGLFFLRKQIDTFRSKLLQLRVSLISSFSWIISGSGWFWRAKPRKRLLVPSHVYGTAAGTCKPLSASEIRVCHYPLADFLVMKWQWSIGKRSFMPAGVMSPRLRLHRVSQAISGLYHLGQKLHSGVIAHPGWDGLGWIGMDADLPVLIPWQFIKGLPDRAGWTWESH